jgi:hypothetical protein
VGDERDEPAIDPAQLGVRAADEGQVLGHEHGRGADRQDHGTRDHHPEARQDHQRSAGQHPAAGREQPAGAARIAQRPRPVA